MERVLIVSSQRCRLDLILLGKRTPRYSGNVLGNCEHICQCGQFIDVRAGTGTGTKRKVKMLWSGT